MIERVKLFHNLLVAGGPWHQDGEVHLDQGVFGDAVQRFGDRSKLFESTKTQLGPGDAPGGQVFVDRPSK